jgi:acetyl esterase/lipase
MTTTRRRLSYGTGPRQYVDVLGGPGAGGCVLFVHGGFWRAEKDSESMWQAVLAVADAAGIAGTIEYRTADAGGIWPRCHDDVAAAVQQVWRSTGVPSRHTVLAGHSAGGHLALTAAAELPGLGAVVGLAAVSDLVAAHAENLGDGAVAVLFGTAEPTAQRLRSASPLHREVPACRIELVHGTADQSVPVAQSRRLAACWAGRGDIRLTVVDGARHMHLVNPERPAWAAVADRITGVLRDLVTPRSAHSPGAASAPAPPAPPRVSQGGTGPA